MSIDAYGNDPFDASRSMWHPETPIEELYQMERFCERSLSMQGAR
jgi:hypothetical protein